ncbi:MAG TPA: DNA translocase FtsK 4TM domain-containing protein [Polyangiaceae bacterium]|nr:DNA translocase FtsK 4TM domain-containing protein [Polyangiaceae bacterium]
MGARLFTTRAAADGPGVEGSAETQPRSRFFGRLYETSALLLFAGAAFLFLALVTARVDPLDPTVHGANWVGPVGGNIAAVLIQGFGLVAWLVPLEIALCGAPLFRGQRPHALGLRVAGDLVVAIVLSALVQVALPEALVFGSAPASGNVGLLFGELMREAFSTLGSFLVALTIVGLILIGRASFSFIAGCQRALALLRQLAARLEALFKRTTSAWSEARKLRGESEERARAAALPRIDPGHDEAQILLSLGDDDGDWLPMVQTGTPPLSISEALREGRSASALASASANGSAKFSLDLGEDEPLPQMLSVPAVSALAADESDDDALQRALAGSPSPPLPAPSASTAPPQVASRPAPAAAPAPTKARTDSASAEPRIIDTKPALEVERVVVVKKTPKGGAFQLPSYEILQPAVINLNVLDRSKILEHATRLEKTLADYGVVGKVEEIHPGPTVTTYEVSCEAGTKVSKVASLADDLALGLSRKVRIIAPIPGKNRIGFELPNDERVAVNLRELIEDARFEKLAEKAPLPVVLGRDIVGAPFYADLASMPHVIVAGATGAGKSVGLNVMLSSLLFKRTPDELRLLMIDPKVVELAPFDGIPHMLLPVVTDMKQAATALRWAVDEMERRYQLFANAGTKNITTYNVWVGKIAAGEIPPPEVKMVEAIDANGQTVMVPAAKEGFDGHNLPAKLPYIVIVVDEFADLMMQQGKEVEVSVARLAQKARAAGMHVVLATQRPSVDVITGMIKANFPSRIGFRVAQKVDSRTILDEQGAELLLGRGDMLVKLNGANDTQRVQCPFVSEEEVGALTDHLRAQGSPEYNEAILLCPDEEGENDEADEVVDPRFDEAVRIVAETQRCSTSWLQRKMTVGYNRAAKIVEMMEKRGMVGPPNGAKDREILVHAH